MDLLAREELEIEWNSQFDYISEAFGATKRDCDDMARMDAEYEAAEEAKFIGPHKPWPNDEIPY